MFRLQQGASFAHQENKANPAFGFGAGGAEESAAEGAAESVTQKLQKYVDEAAKQVDEAGDAAFTAGQLKNLARHPGFRAAYRGNRIDVLTRDLIKEDPALKFLKSNYTRGPDFVDPNTGHWWDITTPAEWNKHVAKYGANGTLLKTK